MITLVYAYYDNADMLRRHLNEWKAYGRALQCQLPVIIVDDGSPTTPAADVVLEAGDMGCMRVEVYRIETDIPWNQDGARNLGMFRCATAWALLMDMDHLLPRDQADKMLRFKKRSGVYYMPNQHKVNGEDLQRPHPNGYLFSRSDFWTMGGYDEDFAGWYGSDGNFRKCAKGAGLIEQPTMDFHTIVFRREDINDANTHAYGRKDTKYWSEHNPDLAKKRRAPAYRASRPMRFVWHRVLTK